MRIWRKFNRPGEATPWGVYVPRHDTVHAYPAEALRDMAARTLAEIGADFSLVRVNRDETIDFIEVSR